MINHVEHSSVNAIWVQGEQTQHHNTHRRHRGVGHELLYVAISLNHKIHGCKSSIDNSYNRQKDHYASDTKGSEVAFIGGSGRKHRQVKSIEPVRSELEQNSGKNYRTGRGRLDVSIGQPRVKGKHRNLY